MKTEVMLIIFHIQVSGYASMPITSFPNQQQYITAPNIGVSYKSTGAGCGGADVHSQTSSNDGSSGSEHRRGFALSHFVYRNARHPLRASAEALYGQLSIKIQE